MFENIIGQKNNVELLSSAVGRGNLPPALLFLGPAYAGKLSTALELARGLTCEQSAHWECACAACRAQRELTYPYTVMLGNRYFDQEIHRTASVFLSEPCKPTFFLFLRSLRKLLRRFDNFLWDEHDNHYRKAKPILAQLAEQVSEFDHGDYEQMARKKAKEIQMTVDKGAKLAAVLKGYHVSISQIRALRHWCATTSWQRKIVIIEEADRMNEGARNALLKILEEPPQGLYFVLIAPSKSTIMPTLLSRLRSYQFLQRSHEDEKQILHRIFRQSQDDLTLEAFFGARQGANLHSAAEEFYAGMLNCAKFSDVYPGESAEENFEQFLYDLSLEIRQRWRAGEISSSLAQEMLHDMGNMRQQFLMYRQSAQSLAENFFFRYFNRKN